MLSATCSDMQAGGGKDTYKEIISASLPSTISFPVDPQGRDWSALPVDILVMILGRLQIKNCVRCRAVCVSWNHVFVAKLVSPAPQVPWLMFYQIDSFYRIVWHTFNNNEEECRIRLPKHSAFIGFTSDSYMVFSDKTSKLLAINPLTGSQMHFPPVTTLRKIGNMSISKFALLSRPNTAAVLAIAYNYGSSSQVAFSRVGDEIWTFLGGSEGVVEAIIFYKELLYVLKKYHVTVAWDLKEERPSQRMMVSPVDGEAPPTNMHWFNRDKCYHSTFLVESTGGDLLQVCTISSGEYAVFKLADAATPKWCRVTSLCGDDALMVSPCQSVCVSTRDLPVLHGNCVYSITKFSPFARMEEEKSSPKYSPIHVHSLCDGTTEHIPLPNSEFLIGPRPNWFIPCLS